MQKNIIAKLLQCRRYTGLSHDNNATFHYSLFQ